MRRGSPTKAALASWLLAGVMGAGPAHAKDVVLALDGCAQAGSGVLARALRSQLSLRPGAAVLSERDTAEPLGGLPDGSLADAQRLLTNARFEMLEQAAYDRAERTLRTAEGQLFRQPPSEERWRALEELRTMRASIALKRDRREEAERELSALLRVEPDYRPDVDRYPPSMRAFVDGLRSRVAAEPRAPLTLSTAPEGLPVFVDGRPLGKAPVTMELTLGVHQVEASFEGRRGLARKVSLEGPQKLALDARFEGALYPDRGPCFESSGDPTERLASLSRLAPLWSADWLFSARLSEEFGAPYLIGATLNGATGEQVREGKVKLGPAGPGPEAIARLAEFLATGEAVAPVEPMHGVKAEGARRSLRRTGALGLGLGGVLALSIGGAFASQAAAANQRLETLCPGGSCPVGVDEQAFASDDRVRRNSSVAAGVLCAVGVGALVTGAVLLLTAPQEGQATAWRPVATAEGVALAW